MILSQQAPQGRNWSNGGAGPHLNRLFPQIYALPCFVFNSDAFANAQVRQSAVAKLMRYYGTHLIKLFGFFAVEQVKLSHLQSPVGQQCAATPSVDPLKLRTPSQGLRFQLFGQKEKSSGDVSYRATPALGALPVKGWRSCLCRHLQQGRHLVTGGAPAQSLVKTPRLR